MRRWDILNKFIDERKFSKYLEIGIHDPNENFNKINALYKIGIDPDPNANANFIMTSDEFFKNNKENFDIIFIDGLHEAHQVYKDIKNSLKILNKNGIIMCHDCNPLSLEAAKDYEDFPLEDFGKYTWNGDSWKGYVKYRFESPYLTYTLKDDEGCGIIDTANIAQIQQQYFSIGEMTYSTLEHNRVNLLGLR